MHINVALKTPNEETFYIEIERSLMNFGDSLDRIKALFERETAIPPHEQVLEYFGEELPSGNARKIELSPLDILPKSEYPELLMKSIVYVDNPPELTWDDVDLPENRIRHYETLGECCDSIASFYNKLNRPRLVTTSMASRFQTLLANFRKLGMDDFFEVTPDKNQTKTRCASEVEMECYNNIFNNVTNQWKRIKYLRNRSPELLSSFFASMLMLPPFLWDEKGDLELLYGVESPAHMFIKPLNTPDFYKYSSQSNIAVLHSSIDSIPFVISAVDSGTQTQTQETVKMVLQGSVLSRQWRDTLNNALKDRVMPLGLYVYNTLRIELFLFHADKNDKVGVFQKSFSGSSKKGALELARCLFNYRDRWLEKAIIYSSNRMDALKSMVEENKDLPTFTSGKKKTSKTKKNRLDSNSDEPENPPSTVLQSAATVICPAGTHIEFTKRPNVACVKTNTLPVKTVGFIKITSPCELSAFDRIRGSGCEFLLDHVVLPKESVEMYGETVIFLPYGGETLRTRSTRIGPMTGYELSIAVDILKIFSHLHDLRVAHLDIKPGNILWDRSSRTVRVIDFDSSCTFEPGESSKVTGKIGTPGYLAPEAEAFGGKFGYDAFLADAYGCGRVLEEMMADSFQSDSKEFVLRIVESLKGQLRQRWTIHKGLAALSNHVEERARRQPPEHTASRSIDNPRSDVAEVQSVCVH